jgi:hypothetical protein
MRKTENILIFLFSLFYLLGCGQEKVDSNFEQNVFMEVLPKIVDSMFVDIRPFPSPPKEIRNEKDRKLKMKKWKEYQTSYLKKIPKYNTKYTIAIVEKIGNLGNLPSSEIDFEKLNNTEKFIFKKRSEFPEKGEIWKESLNYSFVGIFSFSRIRFEKDKSKAEIYVNYRCGSLCGKGGTVYIIKKLGKWIIEEILIEEVS